MCIPPELQPGGDPMNPRDYRGVTIALRSIFTDLTTEWLLEGHKSNALRINIYILIRRLNQGTGTGYKHT